MTGDRHSGAGRGVNLNNFADFEASDFARTQSREQQKTQPRRHGRFAIERRPPGPDFIGRQNAIFRALLRPLWHAARGINFEQSTLDRPLNSHERMLCVRFADVGAVFAMASSR